MIRYIVGVILTFATYCLVAEEIDASKKNTVYVLQKVEHEADGAEGYLVKRNDGVELGVYGRKPDAEDWIVQTEPVLKIQLVFPEDKRTWSGGAINSDCHE